MDIQTDSRLAGQQNLEVEENEEQEGKDEESMPGTTMAPDAPLTPKMKDPVVLQYVKGVCEQLIRVFKSYDMIHACFKVIQHTSETSGTFKGQGGEEKVVGSVYHIQCEDFQEHCR